MDKQLLSEKDMNDLAMARKEQSLLQSTTILKPSASTPKASLPLNSVEVIQIQFFVALLIQMYLSFANLLSLRMKRIRKTSWKISERFKLTFCFLMPYASI